MDSSVKTIVITIIVIFALLFVVRSCNETKKVDIRQKSTDQKTSISIDIEKRKDASRD